MQEENLSEFLLRAYQVFYESSLMTVSGYSDKEEEGVRTFIIDFARSYTPYGIIQTTTIGDLVEHVFTEDLNRDFIWKLVFNFFATWGYEPADYARLCQSLAFALDVTDTESADERDTDNYTLTPETLIRYNLDASTLEQHLLKNKWLVVLVLLILNYKRLFFDDKPSIQEVIEKISLHANRRSL